MGMKTVSTKLDEDKELYQRLEELQEEHDTKSEAIRHALREGVDDTDDRINRAIDGAERALTLSSYFLIAGGVLWLSDGLFGATVAVVLSIIPFLLSGVLSTIALGRGITAAGLLRAQGYGWLEMLQIAYRAHAPDLEAPSPDGGKA